MRRNFLRNARHLMCIKYVMPLCPPNSRPPKLCGCLQIFWRDSAVITAADGARYRLHARRVFHGRPKYDIVRVTGDEGEPPWYARALAFFDVRVAAGWRRMALVSWLERTEPTHVAGAETFCYWSRFPDVIPLRSIVRPLRMVTSPMSSEDDSPCLVLLPYGRVNK